MREVRWGMGTMQYRRHFGSRRVETLAARPLLLLLANGMDIFCGGGVLLCATQGLVVPRSQRSELHDVELSLLLGSEVRGGEGVETTVRSRPLAHFQASSRLAWLRLAAGTPCGIPGPILLPGRRMSGSCQGQRGGPERVPSCRHPNVFLSSQQSTTEQSVCIAHQPAQQAGREPNGPIFFHPHDGASRRPPFPCVSLGCV